jgi:hypothetical protein
VFDGDEIVLVSELENRDEVSGSFSFMYGASLSKCRLDDMYELVMKRVNVLQVLDLKLGIYNTLHCEIRRVMCRE